MFAIKILLLSKWREWKMLYEWINRKGIPLNEGDAFSVTEADVFIPGSDIQGRRGVVRPFPVSFS